MTDAVQPATPRTGAVPRPRARLRARPFDMALRAVLALALALSIGLPATFVVGSTATAQERQRPNLLDVLRGRTRRVAPPADPRRVRRVQPPRRVAPQRAAPRRATAAPRRATTRKAAKKPARKPARKPVIRKAAPAAPAAPPAPPPIEKLEDAETVLVIGDFLAGGLADGFEEAFADSPGVRVVDASNGSSGLVRDDYHDWPATLPGLIEEHEPRVVAVQLGANDGQPLSVNGRVLPERSDEWTATYAERAERLAAIVEGSGAELVWVGAPAFRSRAMTADVGTFNAHYAAAAEKAGGAFVDVWEGFVDQDGAYMRSGPDVNGQVVRLRAQDGINLTRAGRRKMAFFAEKDVRRLLDGADAADFGTIASIVLPPFGDELLSAPLQPRMSAPIALDAETVDGSVMLDGDVALAGMEPSGAAGTSGTPGAPATPRLPPTIAPGLLLPEDEGVPSERADNFAWPPEG